MRISTPFLPNLSRHAWILAVDRGRQGGHQRGARSLRPFRTPHRKGVILVLTALLLVLMLAMIAFAVDLGYLNVARTELQRSADAAAIAATYDLIQSGDPASQANYSELETKARARAVQYAALNKVLAQSPGLAQSDVTIGYLANPSDKNSQIVASGANAPNAVRVLVRRASGQNNEVPLFFGRLLGRNLVSMQAEATAAMRGDIIGFTTPSDGGNLNILPFALDEDAWNNATGSGSDGWKYDSTTKQVTAGSDGVRELKLYPSDTGSSGNSGTVTIGGEQGTSFLESQIRNGVTPTDLGAHGGSLEFNGGGKLLLKANPGLSAGMSDGLTAIIGQPRIIPIYNNVTGKGSHAQYTIVKFVGVRVVQVDMKGGDKKVMVQPATVITRGGIFGGGTSKTSNVYSPVTLIR